MSYNNNNNNNNNNSNNNNINNNCNNSNNNSNSSNNGNNSNNSNNNNNSNNCNNSPTFPSLHLRHNSFSSPSVALPTSQLILQPFRCVTYVTIHPPTILSLLLRHKLFTYVTWRAAHDTQFLSYITLEVPRRI